MPTNGNCASPICCAIRNTQSTAATPASLQASTSSCNALSASASVAPISRTAPSPSTAPTSTAGSTGCSRRRPPPEAGRKLAQGIRKCRGDLFLFVTRRDVPATNNDCERALRPSVIFRKVTGGFQLQVGCPDLRRRRLGNRHRQAARQFSSPGSPSCSRRTTRPRPP